MVARIYHDEVDFEAPRKEAWMDDAACSGKDYTQFFPETKREVSDAKEFCISHCKRRIECLMFALKAEKPKTELAETSKQHRFGIYGGLDGKERAALQKKLNESQKEKTNDHG